jgi:predicted nucleic acid-binding protein
MKKCKLKFAGRNGFMLFADWLKYALNSINENIENILQLRLLRHILGDFYEKKVVSKIMHRHDKYSLSFNDAQAVALAIALYDHRDNAVLAAYA